MAETYLTVADVADLLKLNKQTIRNWIDRGELEAVRVGTRRVRVRQSNLDAFIAQNSSEPASNRSFGDPSAHKESAAAWEEFRTAIASATKTAEGADAAGLPAALESLAEAARDLAEALRSTH